MYTDHTPSCVSNGARLSESELNFEPLAHALKEAARAREMAHQRSPETPQHPPRRRATAAGPPSLPSTNVSPARPLADERYLVVRKAALEDAHDLPAMRQGLLPPAEEGVRLLRLPGAKMRRFNWSEKALRRRTNGTAACAMRHMPRRFKNGFREGTQAKAAKSVRRVGKVPF